jgi:hypothetical protein
VADATIRLSQLGRGRRWAEHVAATGQPLAIRDDAGQVVVWLRPATEPVTEKLLDDLASRLPDESAREGFREWTAGMAGSDAWVYHRASGTFRGRP